MGRFGYASKPVFRDSRFVLLAYLKSFGDSNPQNFWVFIPKTLLANQVFKRIGKVLLGFGGFGRGIYI